MGKNKEINTLTNLLAKALRHRIGSIVNKHEIYSQKYAKDTDVLINEARKIESKENWSLSDKIKIKKDLKKRLRTELESKEFIDNKKFDLMNEHIELVLKTLGLN